MFYITLFLYFQNTRYSLIPVGNSFAYKLDRKIGQVWYLRGLRKERIISKANILQREDERAIELAKNSYMFGNSSTEFQIKMWLEKKKGYLKIYGWRFRKVDDNTYLVSYTFDEGKGEVGYFFEVNVKAQIVRKVSGDPELEKIYGLK